MEKTCTKCKKTKKLSNFSKAKVNKDGYCGLCRICRAKTQSEYDLKHIDKIKEYQKKYQKEWYLKNKDRKNKQQKIHNLKRIDKIKEYKKKYYLDNKENIAKKIKAYKEANPDKIRKQRKDYLKSNPEAKLAKTLRRRISIALKVKNCRKSDSTYNLLGCSIIFFKEHIESKFTKGMTWENRGNNGWHFDHIRPCSSFDLSDPEQQKLCFHYTNLQPLWATTKIAIKHGESSDYIGNLEKAYKYDE